MASKSARIIKSSIQSKEKLLKDVPKDLLMKKFMRLNMARDVRWTVNMPAEVRKCMNTAADFRRCVNMEDFTCHLPDIKSSLLMEFHIMAI